MNYENVDLTILQELITLRLAVDDFDLINKCINKHLYKLKTTGREQQVI